MKISFFILAEKSSHKTGLKNSTGTPYQDTGDVLDRRMAKYDKYKEKMKDQDERDPRRIKDDGGMGLGRRPAIERGADETSGRASGGLGDSSPRIAGRKDGARPPGEGRRNARGSRSLLGIRTGGSLGRRERCNWARGTL